MHRSVRNGLAIASMAGGVFFLGQAVASADSNDAAASGDTTSITSSEGGGSGDSANQQDVNAGNYVDNDASSGHIDAGGGMSAVGVLAGNGNEAAAGSDDGHVEASQTVDTAVGVVSEANGGEVAGSNNASAGDGAGNDAAASGDVDSITEGGEGKHGGDATSDNYQHVNAGNYVDNDASSGHIDAGGGMSVIEVIAGNGNKLYCWSDEGDVTCTQNITTIITIISEANGGGVTCSNNASAGSPASWMCHQAPGQNPGHNPGQQPGQEPGQNPDQQPGHNPGEDSGQDSGHTPGQQPVTMPAGHKHHHHGHADSPEHQKAVAPMHTVKAAPAAHRAPMRTASMRSATMTTAQPSGELAYTGSDVSAPLTLGLVALGLGGALTLAGRRRSSATV